MNRFDRDLAASFLPVDGGAPHRAAVVTRTRGPASWRDRMTRRGSHVARRRVLVFFALVSLGAGAMLAATEGYIRVKAAVASVLIDHACDRYLADGGVHRPWPWADTYPVGVLESERLGLHEPILCGASGESMAFGIGHLIGTAGPNNDGNCVLAGHRNTKMAWLARLQPGDVIALRTYDGVRSYVVAGTGIVDRRDMRAVAPTADTRLTLVTCYPLDGLLPGDERFVVVAAAAGRSPSQTVFSSW